MVDASDEPDNAEGEALKNEVRSRQNKNVPLQECHQQLLHS